MTIDRTFIGPDKCKGDEFTVDGKQYRVVRERGFFVDCALTNPPFTDRELQFVKDISRHQLAVRDAKKEVARLKAENDALRQLPTDLFKDGDLLAGVSRWVCALVAASAVLIYLVPSGMWGVVAGAAIAWLQAEWKRWRYAKEAVK